jgi:hypothetical protein
LLVGGLDFFLGVAGNAYEKALGNQGSPGSGRRRVRREMDARGSGGQGNVDS